MEGKRLFIVRQQVVDKICVYIKMSTPNAVFLINRSVTISYTLSDFEKHIVFWIGCLIWVRKLRFLTLICCIKNNDPVTSTKLVYPAE